MTHKMRRENQALDQADCESILRTQTSGVLALCGLDGKPYAVPLSYVYDGSCLYFHGALEGRKISAIAENRYASFCVVDSDDVVPQEFTTRYCSVIVEGTIRVVEDATEKKAGLRALGLRYWPGHLEETDEYVNKALSKTAVIELRITSVSGKESRALAKARAKAGCSKPQNVDLFVPKV